MDNFKAVGIIGTGSYLPDKVLSNKDLENMVETSNEWIITRTGIKERRIAPQDMATSDLCFEAAKKALAMAKITAEDLDMIIVATVTPDHAFPATACILQDRLGAHKAAAFDLEAGCSGFMYAFTIASQFIQNGNYRYVLILGAETFNKIVNWEDRTTCILFGDGAGAAVVGPVKEGYGMLSFSLGADGSGGPWLIQPAGGSRIPATFDTVTNNLHTIHMKGQDVFKFAVKAMADSAFEVLEKAGLKPRDVDWLIPHQANTRIIEAAIRRLGIPLEKTIINLDRYGNMSSASIPVALDEALCEGKIKKDDIVLLVAFGAGMTSGAGVLRWQGL